MSALSRTLPALIAASVLLLTGCDKVADKVADNAAGQIDDQKARNPSRHDHLYRPLLQRPAVTLLQAT